MNNWNFTGNLGNDAEQRFTANSESIVNFSVAVKSGYGEKASTTWAKCSMWGKRGEAVAQYLTKGSLVGVSGEVTLRPWKDKEGVDKVSLEVRVNDLTLLGGKREEGEGKPVERPASRTANEFEDDIPF